MAQVLLLNLGVGGWGWGRIATLATDSSNLLIIYYPWPSFPSPEEPSVAQINPKRPLCSWGCNIVEREGYKELGERGT